MLTKELTPVFSFEQELLLKEKQHPSGPVLPSNITQSHTFLNNFLPKQALRIIKVL